MHELTKLLRFCAVGVLATALHLSVSFVALNFADLTVWGANLFGFLVAAVFSYLGHYHFSFASERIHRAAIARFCVTTLTAYLANIVSVWLLINYFSLEDSIALIIGISVMPIVTFTLSRLWVY
jgi:putative flippase GtrA